MKRVYKSYIIRLLRILTVAVAVYATLIALTFKMQFQPQAAIIAAAVVIIFSGLSWLISTVIQKRDPELVAEVARILYPSAALLSLGLSTVAGAILATYLSPSSLNRQHLVIVLAGLCIVTFLVIRCFDIKYLRNEWELPRKLRDFKGQNKNPSTPHNNLVP